MLILSIDSAGAGCGACVWRDGRVLAAAYERMARGQDQRLMPLILETMKKADVGFDELDRITVTRGPGSFTGLRIGLAVARGIGLASGKPVLGIDRFSIYRAAVAKSDKNVLVVIDSRRAELFCRFYPASGTPHEPVMMTREEIAAFLEDKKDTITVGDVESGNDNEAVICAQLAAEADPNDPQFLPRPLYIRPPDVTVQKAERRNQGSDRTYDIRPVHADQAATLTKLHQACFGAAEWGEEQMRGSLMLATTRAWAAFADGKPIGVVLCQTTEGRSEILTIGTHPAHQKRGIARWLMQAVIEATQVDGSTMYLDVAADNAAAIGLYEKLGFREDGRRRGYYKRVGATVDAVLYRRTSGAA